MSWDVSTPPLVFKTVPKLPEPGLMEEVQGPMFALHWRRRLPSTARVLEFEVIETMGVMTVVLACAWTICDPVPHVMPNVTAPSVDSVTAW
jgi:hypothetical protein